MVKKEESQLRLKGGFMVDLVINIGGFAGTAIVWAVRGKTVQLSPLTLCSFTLYLGLLIILAIRKRDTIGIKRLRKALILLAFITFTVSNIPLSVIGLPLFTLGASANVLVLWVNGMKMPIHTVTLLPGEEGDYVLMSIYTKLNFLGDRLYSLGGDRISIGDILMSGGMYIALLEGLV